MGEKVRVTWPPVRLDDYAVGYREGFCDALTEVAAAAQGMISAPGAKATDAELRFLKAFLDRLRDRKKR